MAKKVKEPKEKHTLRTVLIVIAVILIIGIIGGSTGSNDGEKETEAITDNIMEEEIETETEMTADKALQKYVDSAKSQTINRVDLVEYLAENYSEEEAQNAVENADIDWKEFALEYQNYLLKDKEVYHEDDLREELANKDFTQDEIDYAMDNVDWTLQKDILDFVEEYQYLGVEEDPYHSGKVDMFWDVKLNEDANTIWWNDDDFIEVAIACMQQPETQANDADYYGIQVFDADAQLIYSWLTYDDKYTITQYDWSPSKTNPHLSEWALSTENYNNIISAKGQ